MAIQIDLTQGKCALIDEVDRDLDQLKWYADDLGRATSLTWYAVRNSSKTEGKRRMIRMHRVIFERIIGRPLMAGEQVDHVNQNGLDNRRSNLRLANRTQNNANARCQSTPKSSGYRGVTWNKREGNWRAQIGFNGENKFLGDYDHEEDAARAYDRAAKTLFSTFCRLNFPEGQKCSAQR